MNEHTEEGTDSAEAGATDSPSAEVRAFVNERAVAVPRNASVLDAVRAYSALLADSIQAGTARVSDSRGLPIALQDIVTGGIILRVLAVRAQIDAINP